MINRLFKGLLDFIIPRLCVSCGKAAEGGGEFLCDDCSGKLVHYEGSHPWKETFISRGYIDNSTSLYRFIKDTPIQHLLHSMKYEKMKSIGLALGTEIAEIIPDNINFDITVPVPLHISKERERTYNQSEYICRGISKIKLIPVLPKLLIRNRFTKSQTKMDKLQRIENVKGAFGLNPKYREFISGKNVVLADDVITTGSTILECARILKAGGAGYILICSAAYDSLD